MPTSVKRNMFACRTIGEQTDIAVSVNGVPIRLTYERWFHITENHDDLASYFYDTLETVEKPDIIVRGNSGSLKAAKNLGKNKWLVTVYREISRNDGSVITAYFNGINISRHNFGPRLRTSSGATQVEKKCEGGTVCPVKTTVRRLVFELRYPIGKN